MPDTIGKVRHLKVQFVRNTSPNKWPAPMLMAMDADDIPYSQIPVKVNGKTVSALVDSGAALSICHAISAKLLTLFENK
jgi:hypothetical protein